MSRHLREANWSPSTFSESGPAMAFQKFGSAGQSDPRSVWPPMSGGPLPRMLHGLPIVTVAAKSATAVLVTVLNRAPTIVPNALGIVLLSVTCNRDGRSPMVMSESGTAASEAS